MTSRTQAVLLGGATIGLLSALPVLGWANCCCLWLITGGLVAAYVQQQNQPAPLTAGDGAIAGLLAGIAGAFIFIVVAALFDAMFGGMYARIAMRLLEGAEDLPPDVRDMFDRARGSEAGGLRHLMLGLNFLLMLIIGSIFSTIGGVVGAVVFRAPAAAAPPPPPPSSPPPPPPAAPPSTPPQPPVPPIS